MCGVAGVFNLHGEPVSPVTLRKMTDAIAHRGPDGEGFYVDSFVGLGHRRLAIIDLSPAGHQPMVSKSGQFALTYNGEIYNFQELRLELESRGHHFRSNTDSEVVLNAYMEWGPACVERFNGMFAFAIWDKTKQHLFLARDRYGIKPLYYTLAGSSFVFASEAKGILQHPAVNPRIDRHALVEYFTFQNLFTQRTLLEDVRLFPPGCRAVVELGRNGSIDNVVRPERYWDFDFQEPDTPLDDMEYVEEVDRLFRQAVRRQLVSDVELGCYLSGGMDSGSITAIAASEFPYIKTFTCGFDMNSASGLELGFDEREQSEFMSYKFKTEHYEMVLKSGDMERVVPAMSWHLEEPRVGQSYPNYYVAQLASKFVKVVLSGTGGDELFGGYPWRYYRAVVNDHFEQYVDKYYGYWQRLIPDGIMQHVFSPVWNDVRDINTRDIFRDVFTQGGQGVERPDLVSPEQYVNHSLYFEAKTFLHGLLNVEDKLSMAHGLESRVPFLDNDLVDFTTRIPARLKLQNLTEVVRLNENTPGSKTKAYFEKTKDGKLILRSVMERHIPSEITQATKQGFSAPDASWFRGESIGYVKELLLDPRARLYDYMDRAAISDLIGEHLEGKVNRRLLIWSLINFEWWHRKFLG